MPHALDYLEYDEEEESDNDNVGDDLFGSDDDDEPAAGFSDTRIPVGSSSKVDDNDGVAAHSTHQPPPSSFIPARPEQRYKPITTHTLQPGDKPRLTVDQRLAQLRDLRTRPTPLPAMGVSSLRAQCNIVIRRNSGRIWDIGGLEYTQVAEFLDGCNRDQLEEIENNSTHIKKDTDWLWERFVVEDYPVYYGSCRERKGQQRTSGWRRMYQKAVVDAEERKQLAAERVAERYRQLEAERASKRIVVMDELIAPKRGRSGGYSSSAHSFSSVRRGAAATSTWGSGPGPSKMQTAMAKARNDATRARVALTHASGKYVPPPPRTRTARTFGGDSDLFRNPYIPNSATNAQLIAAANSYSPVSGPRLPAPRVPRPPPTVIAGAYPTPTAETRPRPPTVAPTAITAGYGHSTQPVSSAERFRIDPARDSREARPIHRPQVGNFAAPKPVRKALDFFSAPTPMRSTASPVKRAAAAIASTTASEAKRHKADGTPEATAAATASAAGSPVPAAGGHATPPLHRATPPPRTNKDLESVLFAKKPKPKFMPRR